MATGAISSPMPPAPPQSEQRSAASELAVAASVEAMSMEDGVVVDEESRSTRASMAAGSVLKSIDGNAGVRTVHCARRVSAQLPGEPAPYVPTETASRPVWPGPRPQVTIRVRTRTVTWSSLQSRCCRRSSPDAPQTHVLGRDRRRGGLRRRRGISNTCCFEKQTVRKISAKASEVGVREHELGDIRVQLGRGIALVDLAKHDGICSLQSGRRSRERRAISATNIFLSFRGRAISIRRELIVVRGRR